MAAHSSLLCADYVNLSALPAIHDFCYQEGSKTWITGTSPVMTVNVERASPSEKALIAELSAMNAGM